MCDASNSTLGVVLGQRARVGKLVHEVAYPSRTMDPSQLNYTTIEKELLAIVFAVDKFRSYLLDFKIVVFFDHAALRFLLKNPDAKPRLIRWMLLLQEFNIEIRDKKGAENSIVDHLSKIKKESDPMPIRDEFPNEQLLHITTPTPWFANICNFVAASQFPPEASAYTRKDYKMMLNTTFGMIPTFGNFVMIKLFAGPFLTPRSIRFSSFVMQHLEAAIMDQLGRPGKYLIPTIFKDAYKFVSTCEKCQKARVAITKRHEMPQQPILFCKIFDVWDIDFMGPFPVANGYSYILLAVDYFGVSKVLISDQGSHFYNKAMSSLLHMYGNCHSLSPQTNSQAEVFNKEIKKTLQKMTNSNRKDWSRLLEDALWGHKTAY
ncbi:Retrovirus-related Pol polyprotein, partial [Mucuna pruriens]